MANNVTPDGRSLVLAEFGGLDVSNLRLLHLDGRGEAEDLVRTPYNEQNADMSPDGRWIAYQSDESGRNDVYVRRRALRSDPSVEAIENPRGSTYARRPRKRFRRPSAPPTD